MEQNRRSAMPNSVLLASWSPSPRGLRSNWRVERSEIERLAHTVTLKAQGRLDAAALDLDQIKTQVGRDTDRMVDQGGGRPGQVPRPGRERNHLGHR